MHTKVYFQLFIITIFTAGITTDAFGRKNKFYLPDAIFVQLKSEQRKINSLNNTGNTQDAILIAKDAAKVRQAMINDFSNNFHYCPVYYFLDTNLEKIVNGTFSGVLMDKDGTPISSSPLKNSDTSYYIVYYGLPEPEESINSTSTVVDNALILLDYNHKQIDYFWRSKMFSSKNSQFDYESSISTTVTYTATAEKLERYLRKKVVIEQQ